MDKHFLNFWGHALLNMAKNQEHLETMAKWIEQGVQWGRTDFKDWLDLFNGAYGLTPESPADTAKTSDEMNFPNALRYYYDFMGVVPKTAYLTILGERDALREEVEELKETVRQLRMLNSVPINPAGAVLHGQAVKDFQRMVARQTEQFRELMNSTREFFRYPHAAPAPVKNEE